MAMAIRIARAYTGKQWVLRFEGHYHGWGDSMFGGQVNPNYKNEIPYPVYPDPPVPGDISVTQGLSENAKLDTLLIPYNDVEALVDTVEKYSDQIAIIHFEGIVCNHFNLSPRPGFLEKIRELCTKHHIVMSMDEVITGFRIGPSWRTRTFGRHAGHLHSWKSYGGRNACILRCGKI